MPEQLHSRSVYLQKNLPVFKTRYVSNSSKLRPTYNTHGTPRIEETRQKSRILAEPPPSPPPHPHCPLSYTHTSPDSDPMRVLQCALPPTNRASSCHQCNASPRSTSHAPRRPSDPTHMLGRVTPDNRAERYRAPQNTNRRVRGLRSPRRKRPLRGRGRADGTVLRLFPLRGHRQEAHQRPPDLTEEGKRSPARGTRTRSATHPAQGIRPRALGSPAPAPVPACLPAPSHARRGPGAADPTLAAISNRA